MTKRKDPTGPIKRREMTQVRDRVNEFRTMARVAGNEELEQGLEKLWVDLDRLDLRFSLHHDKKTPAKAEP